MDEKLRVVRYKTNPFIDGMVVPVKDKRVKLSRLGESDNVLINQSTGEIHGTHVATFKRVDSEQFVKLFTANIGLTFDLTSAGIKAFGVLLWAVQHQALASDEVFLDKFALEAFLEEHKDRRPPIKLSMPTLWRGLTELETAKIVAKTMRPGAYFINPSLVFNGDRIAFTTVIERRKPSNGDDRTPDMFPESEG